jgi:hypothetical protein
VEKLLLKNDEWPQVQEAALSFARTLCIEPAREALATTARRALHPKAGEEDGQGRPATGHPR